jgi:rhodanese-related sulfurtransferase
MNTVTVNELAEKLSGGARLRLLDVRSPAEYAHIHATGAHLIPLEEIGPASITGPMLDATDPLYVLCHAGARASIACDKLASLGVKEVCRVDGGTVAWEKASLPVTRGDSQTLSLERQVRIAAGTLVLLGLCLARLIHPGFWGLSAFVGAGLIFAGVTNWCGMGMLIAKMPWNRRSA